MRMKTTEELSALSVPQLQKRLQEATWSYRNFPAMIRMFVGRAVLAALVSLLVYRLSNGISPLLLFPVELVLIAIAVLGIGAAIFAAWLWKGARFEFSTCKELLERRSTHSS